MRIVKNISQLNTTGCVLTIGNFDGVHIGHRKILTAAREIASQRAVELVVMSFEPHPAAILRPEQAPAILIPLTLKSRLLEALGVDCFFSLKANRELLSLWPEDFAERFLVKNIQPAVVVEGENETGVK